MNRTRVILAACFLVTFASGWAVGMRFAKPGPARPGRSWLSAELNLSPEQREQMRKIWMDVGGASSRPQADRRLALIQERDQAILDLLSPEQRAKYDAIQKEHARKLDELAQERRQAFNQAVERTKRILTPEQALKYDEMMNRPRGERGERGFGFRGRHATSSSMPTTQKQLTPRVGD